MKVDERVWGVDGRVFVWAILKEALSWKEGERLG